MEDAGAPSARHDGREAHVLSAALEHHAIAGRGHVVVARPLFRRLYRRRNARARDGGSLAQVLDLLRRLDYLDRRDDARPVHHLGAGQGVCEPLQRVRVHARKALLDAHSQPGQPLLGEQLRHVLLAPAVLGVAVSLVQPGVEQGRPKLRRVYYQRRRTLRRHYHALAVVHGEALVPAQVVDIRGMTDEQDIDVGLVHGPSHAFYPALVLIGGERHLARQPRQAVLSDRAARQALIHGHYHLPSPPLALGSPWLLLYTWTRCLLRSTT